MLVFEETDERFRIDVERSRSGDYLFLITNSHTTSEVRYLRANDPLGEFELVAPREDNHEYYLESIRPAQQMRRWMARAFAAK